MIWVSAPETWAKYCEPIKPTVSREFNATKSVVEQKTAAPSHKAAFNIPIKRRNPITLQP